MRRTAGLSLLAAIVLASCAAPGPTPVDVAAEEAALKAQDAKWLVAAQAKNAAGEVAMFAPDGMAFREHFEPMSPAEFQTYLALEYGKNPKANITWTTTSVRVAPSGDFAMQTGSYTITGIGPKADQTDKGSFLTVWRKVDGTWKVQADMSSTTMPEPVPPK